MSLSTSWEQARRILVVRLDNAGDVVLLSPALTALAKALPNARFTLLASPGGALAAPLLPQVEQVIVHRAAWQQLRPGVATPEAELALVERLRAEAFDAALIFTSFSQTSVAPGFACFLAGIPLRAGFEERFAGQVLTDAVPPPPDALHQAERNLALIEGLGVPVADRTLRIRLDGKAREEAASVLDEAGLRGAFVLLAPGASAAARRYPADAFSRVATEVRARTGLPVLVTGSEAERALVHEVAAGSGVIALAGRTSLPGAAALVERAALVIANNSLTMHLAEALGVPSVVTYAGTDPYERWAPRRTPSRLLSRDVDCAPCFAIDCPYALECLDVAPEAVARAAEEMLAVRVASVGRGAA